MKVKMLRNQDGCADGVNKRLYREGMIYDLPSRLSRLFLEMGAAEEHVDRMVRRPPITTSEESAPNVKGGEEDDIIEEGVILLSVESMTPLEKMCLKNRIIRMSREEMEALIEKNELNILQKPGWRDETVANRIISTLGI
jgi:hypothetical protein